MQTDEDDLRKRLAVFGKNYEGVSLEEQKCHLQAVVGGISVDLWNPSAAADCTGKSRLRTRRLLVNISLKSASTTDGRRSRTCAVIPCWGDLDSSRVAADFSLQHGTPPQTTPGIICLRPSKPHETPEQRALRYQHMLVSGEAKSRAELARRLGVGRSWVTQVLQHLPAASS